MDQVQTELQLEVQVRWVTQITKQRRIACTLYVVHGKVQHIRDNA